MKYVVFLRGVNVGGKNAISMAEIKLVLEKTGFQKVTTYINSGNILLESDEDDESILIGKIEKILKNNFFTIDIVIVSHKNLKHVVKHKPSSWNNDDVRKYVAFIKSPTTPRDVLKEAVVKDGVDFLDVGRQVVYMTTKLSGLTKSGLNKLASKPVYKRMTIRNYNTVEKILALME